jgi:hypothetical protein
MRNTAFVYDNSLALIAFLAFDKMDDEGRAGLLAEALLYALEYDRYFDDGRLRNAYQGGDLVIPPGWEPNGRKRTVRMPGWQDIGNPADPEDDQWLETEFDVSTHTGNLAWAMIALLSYYEEKGKSARYLNGAIVIGEWIESHCRAHPTSGTGGYTGGRQGWEKPDPPGQAVITWKSTEHNIDLYVAFARIYLLTGDLKWKERALYAKRFVESMWDPVEGRFWTGTKDDGETINKDVLPADVNAWALLAFGDTIKYGRGLTWVENNCYAENNGFKGFDFNNDRDGVWFEGTAHMVLAYSLLSQYDKVGFYLYEMERAQTYGPNSNGLGIIAASKDELTTGFDWRYYTRLHIGATAWFIFAENDYNPYWGIPITVAVPIIE